MNVFDPANNGVVDDNVSYQSTSVPGVEVAIKVTVFPAQLDPLVTTGLAGIVFIVKFNVTTLSQPVAFVPDHVFAPDVVYVVPFQVYDPQAVTDSDDADGEHNFNTNTLTAQPLVLT